MIRSSCLVCGSDNLKQIIDLGCHPFADTFISEAKISEPDVIYPLVCELCENCGHVQTKYATDPMLRYAHTEYSYTSSNSAYSRKHWDEFAKEASDELKIKPNALIVEAGSNDGYLLEQFLKNGQKVIGVDPSPNMAALARERNVESIMSLFDNKTAEQILEKHGKADLVIANNTFNHVDNIMEFMDAVAKILRDDGSFIFEQPYWLSGVKNGKFDLIYHEHVNYFTVRSISALLARVGMMIKSVKIVDYHGDSLRVTAQKKSQVSQEPEEVKKMIKDEEEHGIFKADSYKEFMQRILKQRNKFMQKVHKLKEEGKTIIAVGAATKGNTFLNFYKLDKSLIDYVTDASPLKKGKYTPGTRIPIVGDEIFTKYDSPYALILTWNMAAVLKEKLIPFNKNIQFLVPEDL